MSLYKKKKATSFITDLPLFFSLSPSFSTDTPSRFTASFFFYKQTIFFIYSPPSRIIQPSLFFLYYQHFIEPQLHILILTFLISSLPAFRRTTTVYPYPCLSLFHPPAFYENHTRISLYLPFLISSIPAFCRTITLLPISNLQKRTGFSEKKASPTL